MQSAQYHCSSATDTEISHYALNVPFYTHFTSPIRRYADIIMHRFLECHLYHTKKLNITSQKVRNIIENANEKRKNAKKASSYSTLYFLGVYLRQKQIIADCIVIEFGKSFIIVFCPLLWLKFKIRMKSSQVSYKFNEKERTFQYRWKTEAQKEKERLQKNSTSEQTIPPIAPTGEPQQSSEDLSKTTVLNTNTDSKLKIPDDSRQYTEDSKQKNEECHPVNDNHNTNTDDTILKIPDDSKQCTEDSKQKNEENHPVKEEVEKVYITVTIKPFDTVKVIFKPGSERRCPTQIKALILKE